MKKIKTGLIIISVMITIISVFSAIRNRKYRKKIKVLEKNQRDISVFLDKVIEIGKESAKEKEDKKEIKEEDAEKKKS